MFVTKVIVIVVRALYLSSKAVMFAAVIAEGMPTLIVPPFPVAVSDIKYPYWSIISTSNSPLVFVLCGLYTDLNLIVTLPVLGLLLRDTVAVTY